MMTSLLHRLATLVLGRPVLVLVAGVLGALALGSVALTVPVDLSFAGVIGSDVDAVTQRFTAVQDRMGVATRVLLLLEGDDDALDAAAESVAAALAEVPDAVASVQLELPTEWLEENALWVVSDELFAQWLHAGLHPEDTEGMRALGDALSALRDQPHPLARPGARLLPIELASDPMDVNVEDVIAGRSPYAVTERATLDALEGLDVAATFTGLGAMAAQDQAKTLKTISALTPLSLLTVLGLLVFVERRPGRLALVAAPMLLALGATLGVVAIVFGKLTFNEAFFGMFIFGLGVDYALHLIVRLREERAAGLPFDGALRETIVGAGRGIAAGAVTTVGAFSALIWIDDPMPHHMGVAGAVGLALCLLLMLSLLPSAWVLLESRNTSKAPPTVLKVPLVGSLARAAVRTPKLCVVAALLICAVALAGAPRFHPETDLGKVFNRDVPALGAAERIETLFELHFTPWIVITDTLQEAQAVHRRFEADPTFVRVEGVTSLFPGDLTARHNALVEAREELSAVQQSWAALAPTQLSSEPPSAMAAAFRAAFDAVAQTHEALLSAAEQGPPDMATLPSALRSQFLLPDGGFPTFAYALGASLDGAKFREDRLTAEAIHPDATGLGALFETIMLAPARWGLRTFAVILAMVLLILAVDLRDPRWVLLALAPVMVGGLVAFGALCWMDVGFTILLVTVVPLLIGLGVDDGIHVVHRMLEDDALPPDVAAESVGRAIVMTTCTTCASFAVLLFSNHPGMESMALTMLVGLPVCLLGSVTLTPALAVLLGLRGAPRE